MIGYFPHLRSSSSSQLSYYLHLIFVAHNFFTFTTLERATDDNLENVLLLFALAAAFNGGGDDDKEDDDVLEKNVCDSSTSLLLLLVGKAPPLLDVPPKPTLLDVNVPFKVDVDLL